MPNMGDDYYKNEIILISVGSHQQEKKTKKKTLMSHINVQRYRKYTTKTSQSVYTQVNTLCMYIKKSWETLDKIRNMYTVERIHVA